MLTTLAYSTEGLHLSAFIDSYTLGAPIRSVYVTYILIRPCILGNGGVIKNIFPFPKHL